jgi:hypothetical protein
MSVITPFLNTTTNRRVNPLDLQPEDVSIHDIAHALALCNRFAGHTSQPISVAQHSVWVSLMCDNGTDYEIPMAALLHDASEAYLGDITKWLKASPEMKAYRDVERRATRTILRAFNCESGLVEDVEEADKRMVCWEAEIGIKDFFDHAMPEGYGPVKGLWRKVLQEGWVWQTWHEAEISFCSRFLILQARRVFS